MALAEVLSTGLQAFSCSIARRTVWSSNVLPNSICLFMGWVYPGRYGFNSRPRSDGSVGTVMDCVTSTHSVLAPCCVGGTSDGGTSDGVTSVVVKFPVKFPVKLKSITRKIS